MKKKIEVVAAVICKDDMVFCAQRPDEGEVALKWEFPGGKIEKNETHQEALVREIREELKSKIVVDKYLMTIEHEYKTFYITMHVYWCRLISGNLELTEHVDSKWMKITEIKALDWAAADIPIIEKVIQVLK